MNKHDQNSFFNDYSVKEHIYPKSFIFTKESTNNKSQPNKAQTWESTNKENGSHVLKSQPEEIKSVFDKDWVKFFDTKQIVSKPNQNSFRYIQLSNLQLNTIPTNINLLTTGSSSSLNSIQDHSLGSRYIGNNCEKPQDQISNFNIHLRSDNSNQRYSQSTKPQQVESKKSTLIQYMSSIKLSQEIIPTTEIKKKDDYQNVQAFHIPKSYLEVTKCLGQRTFTEKSLLNPQQKPNVQSIVPPDQIIAVQSKHLYYISSVIQAFQSKEDNTLTDLAKDHIQQIVQGVKYALSQNRLDHPLKEGRRIYLPKQDKKRTIIFDLDETLIHCNTESSKPSDIVLQIVFPSGEQMRAAVNIRPYAQYTLETLSKHFEIIIFTASHSSYANKIIEYLDPKNQWISHKLFREHCIQIQEGIFIKDLRIFGNRNLQDLLLVDNSAFSFAFQLDNGIPILPYYDDKNDEQLRYLQTYLMQFKDEQDVRTLNSQLLRIPQYGQYADAVDLIRGEFQDFI